jgi:hypothetical protein
MHVRHTTETSTREIGMSRFRYFATLGVCFLLTLFTAIEVAAAPGKAPKWETFPLTCDGEHYTNTASLGQWSVGHIVGENGKHLVPYDFSITVTDLNTGETLFQAAYTKPGDRGGEPVLCSNYAEILDPETGHLIAIDFTSLVHIRGK